ncbi:MAG: ribbon-helix-helix protein, CopG family [Planctomycetota bacterium]|jgi:Arc/MetJ-type ribon-helix-helix transcriptional regulator
MRSVRLNEELEARLDEAARVTGLSVSELIRDAVRRRCDELLGERLGARLGDVTGAVASRGGHSRRTGRQFVESLQRGRRKRRKKSV